MLVVRGAEKHFGARTLWRNIDFTVEPGEMLGLTGRSGCGKSTLLNCIGMLEPLNSGEITLHGKLLSGLRGRGRRLAWRKDISFLFQDFALMENSTVARNVQLVVPHFLPSKRLIDSAEAALQAAGLGGRGGDPAFQLSGGEQQRVALARVLAKRPALVLADEPTGSLDPRNETMVLDQLRRLADDGATVVVATHSPAVKAVCDSIIELDEPQGKELAGSLDPISEIPPQT